MTLVDLAFTGTRDLPNPWQLDMLDGQLRYHRRLGFSVLHHGDCTGADAEAAKLARSMGYVIHGHPPTNSARRAFFPSDREDTPLPYLHRNEVIVLMGQAGLAVPGTREPQPHSGTWFTQRRMQAAKLPHWIIAPDRMWAVTP
jgi:hypothetical protein